jgi:hypothetical protein
MARLEAAKDSPARPTRQRLWLADGRSYVGDASDQFVRLGPGTNAANPEAWLQRDRVAQHLALGLALDCALTRLAREPEAFWAEVKTVPDLKERYLLVLHAKRDARLFTGTMDIFSSWSFMHDVRYDRSEVLCDAATHRPLEEKDYAGETELKGDYFFEDWLAEPSLPGSGPTKPAGAAPSRIRALLPYEKDGKDQALEMDARFRFARPGVWLLERVESHFRGAESGSVGTLTVLPTTADSFQPIRELLEKAARTEQLLATLQQGRVGSSEAELKPGEWSALPLQAAWTEKAQKAAQGGERETPPPILIGLHRARLAQTEGGAAQIELEGVSTGAWKEFETEWKVTLLDSQGRALATAQTNLEVRAESAPAAFLIQLDLPQQGGLSPSAPGRVSVEGTVRRLSGAYHGPGLWMRFGGGD